MTKTSLDIRKLVVQKLKDGWSQRKVVIDLYISRHAIQRIVLKFQQNETLENCLKVVVNRITHPDLNDYSFVLQKEIRRKHHVSC